MNNPDKKIERITVLAKDFTPAAMEFHKKNMSAKGYRMEGTIVSRRHQCTFAHHSAQDSHFSSLCKIDEMCASHIQPCATVYSAGGSGIGKYVIANFSAEEKSTNLLGWLIYRVTQQCYCKFVHRRNTEQPSCKYLALNQ